MIRLPIALAALLFLASCGAGDPGTPAQQTFEAIRQEAEQTPVDNALREYATQLCAPLTNLLRDTAPLFARFAELDTAAAEEETPEDFEAALAAFGDLAEPFEDFLQQVRGITPPSELQAYHDSVIDQTELTIDALRTLREEGLLAAFALEPIPGAVDEPPGFDAALIQQCAGELADVVDELGPEVFEDGLP